MLFTQGNIDQFDYPKKGKNIPPSKHDAPPKEVKPVEERQQEEAGQNEGDQAPSYYDEDGNRVDNGEYGDEQQNYGEE